MAKQTFDRPSDVVAEEGRVLMDGPGDINVALTPDAAYETGGRLIDAAAIARGQQRGSVVDSGRPEPPLSSD